jgi:two-component system sensor histidine kinase BaeS
MKSLFSKILLSLVVTVLIALALVLLMTRVNMTRGMLKFIEQQEAAQLAVLVPELAELYQENGSWAFLQESPRRWNRLLRISLAGNQDEPFDVAPRGRGRPGLQPPHMRQPGHHRGRLFLLDSNQQWVAGAVFEEQEGVTKDAISVEGQVVGWVGFTPLRAGLPPEARLFVSGQHRALLISLVVALAVALGLGFLLARHFSRPLRQLAQTVDTLSDGNYAVRATVTSKDEIGRLGAGVNQLAESLASNRSMRRRWMADIAHELRTPVSILKGEIEAIQDGLRPADEKTLASLGEEADHLSRLVNDLQTLALSDAGALDFRLEQVDLTELVRQQLQAFDGRLRERGIEVTSDLPGGLLVNGDAQRLRQLMQNLLENSSRYVTTGGALECRAARTDGRVTLLLDDSGPGLTAEQMTHLFDRFYRADSSRSRAHGGSGLGLSICRNIVEAHQGSIHAEVSPLGGLRIRLTLPAIAGTSG